MTLGDSMDLPFEASTPFPITEHMHVSGGVVVSAAVADLDHIDQIGPSAALLFRFATPTGSFYPPLLLVLNDEQARQLPALIAAAVDCGVTAAAAERRKARP